MNATSNDSHQLTSCEDWPYGFGICWCGCGKKVRVVDGVLQKFYRKYHERWLHDKMQRELRNAPESQRLLLLQKLHLLKKQLMEPQLGIAHEKQAVSDQERQTIDPSKYPLTDAQKPLPESQKRARPNKYAIAKHLPSAFNVSQSEVNQVYADKDRGSPTASEREKQFPHLNAPTVELKQRFNNAVADEAALDSAAPKQPELFGSSEKPERLNRQLAWIKANKPLLEAISRARDRADTAVKGAYIRNREKVDVEFRLLQRIRGRISAVLNGRVKNSSTLRLLGCTVPELRAQLEKQFSPGMSWLNYGEWHVDHIRPCASFDFSAPTSLAECFHYTNLQPMWGADNAKKNSRWEGKLIRRKKQE